MRLSRQFEKSIQSKFNVSVSRGASALIGFCAAASLLVGCGSGDPLSSKERASTAEALEFMGKAQKASGIASRFSQGMSVTSGLEIGQLTQFALASRSSVPRPRPPVGAEPQATATSRPSRPSRPSDEGNLRFDSCRQEIPRPGRPTETSTDPTAAANLDMTVKVTGSDCPIEMTLTMRGTGQRPNYLSMTMKANSEEFKTRYDFTSFSFTIEGDMMAMAEAITGRTIGGGSAGLDSGSTGGSAPATNASISFKMTADSPSMGSSAWENKIEISNSSTDVRIAHSGKVGFNRKSATYRIAQTYDSNHRLTASEAFINDERLNQADYEKLSSASTPATVGGSSTPPPQGSNSVGAGSSGPSAGSDSESGSLDDIQG